MNPTEAKFHDDLDAITEQLDLGVRAGKFTWRDVQSRLAAFKHQTGAVANKADQCVREYTWTSLALVGGLSVLLGLITGRR